MTDPGINAAVEAAEAAGEKGMKVLGLSGKSGGQLARMVDEEIRVKGKEHSDRIQEGHIKILQILVLIIEQGVL